MESAPSCSAAAPRLHPTDDQLPQTLRLDTLPRDVQLCILARCGTTDLAAVTVTCSRLRSIAQTDELWRSAAKRAFAWKPALAGVLRAAATWAHWLETPQKAAAGTDSSCMPQTAQHSTASPQNVVDGTEWLLARAGTRLRAFSAAFLLQKT